MTEIYDSFMYGAVIGAGFIGAFLTMIAAGLVFSTICEAISCAFSFMWGRK